MSLFKKAKETAPTKTTKAKAAKPRITVSITGFFEKLKRQAYLKKEIKSLEAESELLDDEIKEVGKAEWAKMYDSDGVNPESVMIEAKHNNDVAQFMLLVADKYIIINQERADFLKETYGNEIVTTTDTYEFDAKMVEKYGEVISDLIMNSEQIAEEDKEKIIKAKVTNTVAKGTIDKLKIYADKTECSVADMIEVVKPVTSTKNVEFIEASAVY
jgi:hypothetical protein